MDKTPSVPANVKEEATLLFSSSTLMIYLVQNILDFARYINKSLMVSVELVDLNHEIAAFMDLYKIKIMRKNLKLEVEIEDGLEIQTDREKMLGLLHVFVENSIRYTSSGKVKVIVRKAFSPRFIRFEIHDTGTGIGEEDLEKLAKILKNPFANIQTNGAAGIGIGIRIAQVLLLQLSSGEIAVKIKSIKGEGTIIKYEILRKLERSPEFRKFTLESIVTKQFEEVKDNKIDDNSSGLGCEPDKGKDAEDNQAHNMSFGEGVEVKIETNSNISELLSYRENVSSENIENSGILHRPPTSSQPKLLPRSKFGYGSLKLRLCPTIRVQSITNSNLSFWERHSEANSSANSRSINGRTIKGSDINGSDKSKVSNKKLVAVVIDDEILNADFFQECLELLGFEVYVAYNGELGIELFMRLLTFNTKVDVLFIDYSMPRLNGDECVKRLKTPKFDPIIKDCIIVGLTAHRDPVVKNQCLESGMNFVDYKPFSFNSMKNFLKKCKLIE